MTFDPAAWVAAMRQSGHTVTLFRIVGPDEYVRHQIGIGLDGDPDEFDRLSDEIGHGTPEGLANMEAVRDHLLATGDFIDVPTNGTGQLPAAGWYVPAGTTILTKGGSA